MVHYTEYVANDPPYATFRFFYRSRKTLAKMGFIKPPAQPKTMANRRNMNTQLQSMTPLSVANPLALNPFSTKTGLAAGLPARSNLTVFDQKVKCKPRETTTRPKPSNIIDLLGIDSMDDDSNGEDDDVSSNISTRATTGTLTPNPPLPPTSKPNFSPGSMFASDYDPYATVDPKLLAVNNPSFSSTHTSDTEILPPEQRVGYRAPETAKLMHELKTPMTGKLGAPTTTSTSYSTSMARNPFGGGGGGGGAYESHSFRTDCPAENISDNEADDEGERPRGRSVRRRGSAGHGKYGEEDVWGSYPYGSLSVGAGTDDNDSSLYDVADDDHGLAGNADDEGLGDRLGRVELGKKRDRDEGKESGAGAGAGAGDSGAGTVRVEEGRDKVGEQAAEEMAPKKKMMRLVTNVGATGDGEGVGMGQYEQ
ncbi:hypothetical protein LTS18_008683 [Coniosporium uncinatum]|uniref:Uncharacterized protein n=1 Tax=Coniosporium uncinatum TaxID=93489 RepID=A0ACC3DAB2_9PEZI|nr:hypothetical protein LTS18_008683 [Coniosporium uncinatum]